MDNNSKPWILEDVESAWNLLSNGIRTIIQRDDTLSLNHTVQLHSKAYLMCFNKYGERLYTGLREELVNHLEKQIRPDVLKCSNKSLLQQLHQKWIDYQKSVRKIDVICESLDRLYIVQEENKLDDVHTMCLTIFRDHVVCYGKFHDQLRETMLDMVMLDRNGEAVDHSAIKNVCKMLTTLGIGSRWVYEDVFERPFLTQSASFYEMESQKLLSASNAGVYTEKVESRIKEESDRAILHLNKDTEPRIIKIVEDELINKHMKTTVEMKSSGIMNMIENSKTEDLACMYKLLLRSGDALQTYMEAVIYGSKKCD